MSKGKKIIALILMVALLTTSAIALSACHKSEEVVPTAIAIKNGTWKLDYKVGEALDINGAKIIVSKSDGNEEEVDVALDFISGFDSSVPKDGAITVKYKDLSILVDYQVRDEEVVISTPEFVTITKADGQNLSSLMNADTKNYKIKTSGQTKITYTDFLLFNDLGVEYLDLSEAALVDSKMPDNAFMLNTTLKNIILPNTLREIGVNAFRMMSALESIALPDTVSKINGNPFAGSEKLSSIYCGYDNPNFMSIGGVLYSKSGDLLVAYPAGREAESFVINGQVVNIGEEAFYNSVNLKSLEIPSTLTEIRKGAFAYCTGLETIDFKEGVSRIGDNAFEACSNVSQIVLPVSLSEVGAFAFKDCTKISAFVLSASLTEIKAGFMENCSSLTEIEIPTRVSTVDVSAFKGASSLAEIKVNSQNATYAANDGVLFSSTFETLYYFPEGKIVEENVYTMPSSTKIVESGAFCNTQLSTIAISDALVEVKDKAFYNNSNLKKFTVSANHTNFLEVGGALYSRLPALTLVKYPDSLPNSSFTVKNGTYNIAPFAFSNALSLSEVTIVDVMSTLSDYSFAECYNLTKIYLPKTVTTIGSHIFYDCDLIKEIIVNSTKLALSSDMLAECYADSVKLVAPVNPRYNFHGWYNAAIEGENLPETLNSDTLTDDTVFYARYGSYLSQLDIVKKDENYSDKFYISEAGAYGTCKEEIFARYQLQLTNLDNEITTTDLSESRYDGLYEVENLGDNEVELRANYEYLSAKTVIKVKLREPFDISYSVNESIGGKLIYKNTVGVDESAVKNITKKVYEGSNDGIRVTAVADEGYMFDRFEVVIGKKQSIFFEGEQPLYNAQEDYISIMSVMTDVDVIAYFKPIVSVGMQTSNKIDDTLTDNNTGGHVTYAGRTLDGVSEGGTFSYELMLDKALSGSIIAEAESTVQEGYHGYGDVYGYSFDNWNFYLLAGGEKYKCVVMPDTSEGAGEKDYVITYTLSGVVYTSKATITTEATDGITVSSELKLNQVGFDMTVEAVFTPYYEVVYNIKDNVGGNFGTVEEDGNIVFVREKVYYVLYGEDAPEVIANADDCYEFVDWSDGVNEIIRVDESITAKATYTANFNSLIPTDVTRIYNANDLRNIESNMSGNYLLMADIDLGGMIWTPIGGEQSSFNGMLDGSRYTIKNFVVENVNYAGLFGNVTGEIRNLIVENVSINVIDLANKSEVYAGAIAGYLGIGSISVCEVKNVNIRVSQTENTIAIGGLVGKVDGGVVSNSIVSGDLQTSSKNNFSGGISGDFVNGSLFNCIAITTMKMGYGNANGEGAGYFGGVVGRGDKYENIRSCYYDKTVADSTQTTGSYQKVTSAIGKITVTGGANTNNGLTTESLKRDFSTYGALYSPYVWSENTDAYPSIKSYDDLIREIAIESIGDIEKLQYYPSGNFILLNDLNFEDYEDIYWNPIAYFSGTFNGNRLSINGLNISTSLMHNGFFARVGAGAVIKNIGFTNLYMETNGGSGNLGGIVGLQTGGIIFGSYVMGTIVAYDTTDVNIGGLVGRMDVGGIINNSYAVMEIASFGGINANVAGVVGLINANTVKPQIKNTYSASTIYADTLSGDYYLAGLIGLNKSTTAIIQDNFYIYNNIEAAEEEYLKPGYNVIMHGNNPNTGEADNRNYAKRYTDIGNEPFTNWNRSLWIFDKGLNPRLEYVTEYFVPTKVLDKDGNEIEQDGTVANPFYIDTAEQLRWLKTYNQHSFKLAGDIDLASTKWSPFLFAGTLDGNNYVIDNFHMNAQRLGGAGLFSTLNGTVKNLDILNININIVSQDDSVVIGGLASKIAKKASILNVAVQGEINVSDSGIGNIVIGGLVGNLVENFNVNSCYTLVDIKATTKKGSVTVGGIAATVGNVTISNCAALGSITSTALNSNIGGIVGATTRNLSSTVMNSTSKVSITAKALAGSKANIGGIVGRINTYDAYTQSEMINLLENKVIAMSVKVEGTTAVDAPSVNIGGIIGYNATATGEAGQYKIRGSYVESVYNFNLTGINDNAATIKNYVGVFIGMDNNDDQRELTASIGRMSTGTYACTVAIGSEPGSYTDLVKDANYKVVASMLNNEISEGVVEYRWDTYSGTTILLDTIYTKDYLINADILSTFTPQKMNVYYRESGAVFAKEATVVKNTVNTSKAGIYVVTYEKTLSQKTYYLKQFVKVA